MFTVRMCTILKAESLPIGLFSAGCISDLKTVYILGQGEVQEIDR